MAFGGSYVLSKGYQLDGAVTERRFLKAGSDSRHLAQNDSAGGAVVGVCTEEITASDATDGRVANVDMLGITLVEAGAAVSAFAEVMSDASGRAIAATSTNLVVGMALDGASAAGDWIAVILAGPAAQKVAA